MGFAINRFLRRG